MLVGTPIDDELGSSTTPGEGGPVRVCFTFLAVASARPALFSLAGTRSRTPLVWLPLCPLSPRDLPSHGLVRPREPHVKAVVFRCLGMKTMKGLSNHIIQRGISGQEFIELHLLLVHLLLLKLKLYTYLQHDPQDSYEKQ